jgi:hypothetical protein
MFLWSCDAFQFLGAAGEDSSAARLGDPTNVRAKEKSDNQRDGIPKAGFMDRDVRLQYIQRKISEAYRIKSQIVLLEESRPRVCIEACRWIAIYS